MKEHFERAQEYSSFEESARKLEGKLREVKKSSQELVQKMKEMKDEIEDYKKIENDFFTQKDLKDRIKTAREGMEREMEESEAAMREIGREALAIADRVNLLRRVDKRWDDFVRDPRNEEKIPKA